MDLQAKKKLHLEVFNKETDYIPLLINVNSEEPTRFSVWEGMHDPEKVITEYRNRNKNTLKVNSDRVMMIESNFLECLIPSLFGAEIYESPGGLIDAKAFIADIYKTEKLEVKDLYSGEMERALKHLRYLKEHPIESVQPLMSRFMSPLDYAVIMRGGDFYLDLMEEPELAMDFMSKITDITIKVINIFMKELGMTSKDYIAFRGIYFPGIRLTGDAVVNLSPRLIREMMIPQYQKFADEFGKVMLHYCCLPAPSGHVLPTLTEYNAVDCVDNWQGFKTFFPPSGEGMDQEKITVCTDLTYEEAYDIEEYIKKVHFFGKVKRKGGRGLVVSVNCPTIEAAERLYDRWVNCFIGAGVKIY